MPQLVGRHVLDRGEDLDRARLASRGGDRVADAREVRAHALGAQPVD
jgi:hypothetical protein